MRLALSGGGTGGHVYPALSIAGALGRALPSSDRLDVLYLGSANRAEREIIRHAGIEMRSVQAAPMRGRMPWEMAANAVKIAAGMAQLRAGKVVDGEKAVDEVLRGIRRRGRKTKRA